jgi:ketosteroid isomerase-like protein
MNKRTNHRTNQADHFRDGIARCLIGCATLPLISLMMESAIAAGPEDEVRATFDRFVVAQNAHDIQAVRSLLLDSQDFLWITRGTPVWGQEAALKRFVALYEGTWRLEPDPSSLKVTMVGDGVAQVYVPIMFTIGATGQPPQQTRFLMNQVLVKTQGGWRVSSILPIPAPAQ